MAEPDCPFCEASGWRACDLCGGVVFKPIVTAFGPRDICPYCRACPSGTGTAAAGGDAARAPAPPPAPRAGRLA